MTTIAQIIREYKERIWFLFRYGITGVLGAIIQTGTLYVWVDWLGLYRTYLLGAVLGFIFAVTISFMLQKYWTFRDRTTHRTHRQLMWYTSIALGNVLFNILMLALTKQVAERIGIDFFAGWYLGAQIVIVVVASCLSFVANYLITFREVFSESFARVREPDPSVEV